MIRVNLLYGKAGPIAPAQRRPIGLASGTFLVPASFFAPLPEELLSLFNEDVA